MDYEPNWKSLLSADTIATAEATIEGAKIQGLYTVSGAIIALLAAYIAYLAAGRQVRLVERQHKERVHSYRLIMNNMISTLIKDLAIALMRRSGSSQDEKFAIKFKAGDQLIIHGFKINKELSPENWERQSILGDNAFILISALHESMEELLKFEEEAASTQIKNDGKSKSPTFSNVKSPQGFLAFSEDNAFIQYAKLIEKNRVNAINLKNQLSTIEGDKRKISDTLLNKIAGFLGNKPSNNKKETISEEEVAEILKAVIERIPK